MAFKCVIVNLVLILVQSIVTNNILITHLPLFTQIKIKNFKVYYYSCKNFISIMWFTKLI